MVENEMGLVSPWTGRGQAVIALDDGAQIEAKLREGHACGARWAATHLDDRIALVEEVIRLAERDKASIAELVTTQMGKPISESLGEVATMLGRARMMTRFAPDALRDEEIDGADGIRRLIVRQPLGLVLDIAAWNYPLLIAVNVVIPAVLAGNAVLLKHASQTLSQLRRSAKRRKRS